MSLALNAARQMQALFTRINDKAAGEQWQQEVSKRTSKSKLTELELRELNGG
jgi:hypothetical protein